MDPHRTRCWCKAASGGKPLLVDSTAFSYTLKVPIYFIRDGFYCLNYIELNRLAVVIMHALFYRDSEQLTGDAVLGPNIRLDLQL